MRLTAAARINERTRAAGAKRGDSLAEADHDCFQRMDETLHARGEQLQRESEKGRVRIGVVRIPGRAARPPRATPAPLVALFCPFCGVGLHP